ncbi:hypothetical protein SAMN05421827_1189 [Pedobacter terrae]|uniref:Uncharacterized protein n=1 Tax=Pedobacter terrae TaxID=405671 RepID=A0A1G8A5U2_9SPHI|nr:hypothetical protein SAMN05421827_1189 [Pedobacter terrae]
MTIIIKLEKNTNQNYHLLSSRNSFVADAFI